MPIRVIIPKRALADPKRMALAIQNGLDAAAKAAKVDFGVTVQTWNHQPDFTIQEDGDFKRVIGTDDEIYGYVNSGTKPHIIQATAGKVLAFGPSSPKTAPRVIGSGAGSRGGASTFRKRVQHPGTQARDFDQAIAEKWQDMLPQTMQRAIDAALGD